jgi:hypothetical protein
LINDVGFNSVYRLLAAILCSLFIGELIIFDGHDKFYGVELLSEEG